MFFLQQRRQSPDICQNKWVFFCPNTHIILNIHPIELFFFVLKTAGTCRGKRVWKSLFARLLREVLQKGRSRGGSPYFCYSVSFFLFPPSALLSPPLLEQTPNRSLIISILGSPCVIWESQESHALKRRDPLYKIQITSGWCTVTAETVFIPNRNRWSAKTFSNILSSNADSSIIPPEESPKSAAFFLSKNSLG